MLHSGLYRFSLHTPQLVPLNPLLHMHAPLSSLQIPFPLQVVAALQSECLNMFRGLRIIN